MTINFLLKYKESFIKDDSYYTIYTNNLWFDDFFGWLTVSEHFCFTISWMSNSVFVDAASTKLLSKRITSTNERLKISSFVETINT